MKELKREITTLDGKLATKSINYNSGNSLVNCKSKIYFINRTELSKMKNKEKEAEFVRSYTRPSDQ